MERVEDNGLYKDKDKQECVVTIYLASYSKLLDMVKRYKTFQKDSLSYKEVLEDVVKVEKPLVDADIKMEVSDVTIASAQVDEGEKEDWAIQYDQTAWEYILMMASRMNACVFADITAGSESQMKTRIHIGAPEAAQLTEKKEKVSSMAEVIINDFGAGKHVRFDTLTYGLIGDKVALSVVKEEKVVSSGNYVITEIDADITEAAIKVTTTALEKSNIKQRVQYNQKLSGLILDGKVTGVEANKVKIKFYLKDKDNKYDWEDNAGATKDFVFSTIYASQDSSGFYCMPEVEDEVRVFLPDSRERNAFVSSAANKKPLENPQHKRWKAPDGKEILLTEDGICINCKENSIYINLKKEGMVEICSSQQITVRADENVDIVAKQEINVNSDKEIHMGVGKSSIKITGTGIVMGAKGIYVN